MQSASGSENKMQETQGLNPGQTWARVAVVLGLTILYAVTFRPLVDSVGLVGSALIAIPVAMAGWYFGINAGLVASFLGNILCVLLLMKFDGGNWYTWILIGWPGNLMVVLVGYIAGRLQKGLTENIRIMDELRSRERYLSLINIITKDILNPKKPEDRYYYLILHLANMFIADHAHLVRWDAIREQAVLVASTIASEKSFSELVLDSSESSLTKSVLQTGHALVLNEGLSLDYVINPAFLKLPPTQSVFCLPLIAKEYKFGVVIIAFNTPRHFTSNELKYAELAANQIALVFWSCSRNRRKFVS